ncbi:OmpA family protein [Photobacterium sp. 1_MG-2023]|uniref:OmpA family protein n=1 Tax=Photobacterium sp. 1_MG-2023 TaxID=3062646 RepID=UPI0026E2B60C|nr:OmpA family protein [Photobacterium sp. 1_MG-2023]MDO6706061.1 OmpA family protein [Photobacterium sp. 1_MG-2023]
MAIEKKIQSGFYLMGRLYNRKGEISTNAKFKPLPFETLILPDSETLREEKVNGEGDSVQTVNAKFPIASTDEVGKLSYLNASFDSDELSIVSIPTTDKNYSNDYKVKIKWFPSQLVPLYNLNKGESWLEDLTEVLNKLNDTHSFSTKTKFLDVGTSKNQLLDKYEDADNEIHKSYNSWYDSLENEKIRIIEVPQFYTVVLTFSDENFIGARVKMKDIPVTIKVSGDVDSDSGEAVSEIKSIDHELSNGEVLRNITATFWIESEINIDSISSAYARFDISFEKFKMDKLQRLDVSLRKGYSLKEKVFDLPIRTALGRSALINGDPISVEEALINHSPEYFTELIKKLSVSDDKLGINKNEISKNYQEFLKNIFNTSKGVFQSVVGSFTTGSAWNAKSKVVLSTVGLIGKVVDGKDNEFYNNALAIAGIGDSINTFIDAASGDALKTAANPRIRKFSEAFAEGPGVQKWLKARFGDRLDEINIIPVPEKLQNFLKGMNSYADLLAKPLKVGGDIMTIGQAVYNLHDTYEKFEKSDIKGQEFNLKSGFYINKIQSPTVNQAKPIALLDTEQVKENQKILEDIHTQLRQIGGDENFISVNEVLGDLSVKLASTWFEFDRASLNTIDPKVNTGLENLARLIENLPDPIPIEIAGFTCDRGSEAYNLNLSTLRARAVKEAIIDSIPDDKKRIWELFIWEKGYGESKNLFPNDTEENRKRNRRVEIKINFNAIYDYPVSRVGLSILEKSRKEMIKSELDLNDSVRETTSSTVDATMLAFSAAFPVAMATAGVLIAAGQLVSTVADFAYEKLFKDEYTFKNAIKNLGEVDATLSKKMIATNAYGEVNIPFLKSYLKRALALNGLVRLLKRYQLEIHLNPENKQLIEKKFNIKGYIDKFILVDQWDIDNIFDESLNLDEYWLDVVNYDGEMVFDSYDELIAKAGYYVTSLENWIFGDETKIDEVKQLSSSYHKYFPVHCIGSESVDSLVDMFTVKLPTDLTNDIFKKVIISARKPGDEKWTKFHDHYQIERSSKLSPYDNIRILVIVDEKNEKLKEALDEEQIIHLPITAKATALNWWDSGAFWGTDASENTQYVREIFVNELTEFERESLEIQDNKKLYGTIIYPSFYFGAYKVQGTRPVAWYNHPTLKSLFGKGGNTSSGVDFTISYRYRLEIPNNDDVDQLVCYRDVTDSFWDDEEDASEFNLSLSTDREYKLKNKTVVGDHLFYEEGFLKDKNPTKGSQIKYPKIFDSAKVFFWIKQEKLSPFNSSLVTKDSLQYFQPKTNKDFLGFLVDGFDWDSDLKIRVLVTTPCVDTKVFDDYRYSDKNKIPVSAKISMQGERYGFFYKSSLLLEEVKSIYRIGKIVSLSGKYIFKPTQYEFDESTRFIESIINDFEKLSQHELQQWVTGTYMRHNYGAYDIDQDIDIYGVDAELKYKNVLGQSVNGLMPSAGFETVRSNNVEIRLNLSGAENSGLESRESSTIILRENKEWENTLPKRWIKTGDNKLIELAKEQIKTNKQSNLSHEAKKNKETKLLNNNNIKAHDFSRHMLWIESNQTDLKVINSSREELLEEWSGE